ncbi:MAG: hypothetical protein R2684_13515 [Pyrinomonadaceae bacterium]
MNRFDTRKYVDHLISFSRKPEEFIDSVSAETVENYFNGFKFAIFNAVGGGLFCRYIDAKAELGLKMGIRRTRSIGQALRAEGVADIEICKILIDCEIEVWRRLGRLGRREGMDLVKTIEPVSDFEEPEYNVENIKKLFNLLSDFSTRPEMGIRNVSPKSVEEFIEGYLIGLFLTLGGDLENDYRESKEAVIFERGHDVAAKSLLPSIQEISVDEDSQIRELFEVEKESLRRVLRELETGSGKSNDKLPE